MQLRKEQIEGNIPVSVYNQTKIGEVTVNGLTESPIIDPLPEFTSSYASVGTSYNGIIRGKMINTTHTGLL